MAGEGQLRQNDSTDTALSVEIEGPRAALIETRGFLRTEKITRIRAQILQGAYHISAAQVAKAILQSGASRLFPKKKEK